MAQCLACGKEVTTHLYVAVVDYGQLQQGGDVKATHVGVRLPEDHLRLYRQNGLTRNFLPALAGDTTDLEAWSRKLANPRANGTVQGRRSVITAERVAEVKEDVDRAIENRHAMALIENHCRGHELDEVVKVIGKHPTPLQLRWNPGEFIRPLLKTGSPDGHRRPAGWRGIIIRNPSDLRDGLRQLLEVN